MAQVDLLSDRKIEALRPRQKPYRVADGRAMYLLVTPTGGKLWRLKFRLHGKERTLALGAYPDVPIETVPETEGQREIKGARDLRDAARKLIAADIDPVAQRREQRKPKPVQAGPTFRVAAKRYFGDNKNAWSESHRRDVQRIVDELSATLGDKAIDAIQPEDVEEVLAKVEDRDALTYARDVRLYFRCVVKHYNGKNRKHRIADPSADVDIKKPPKVKHHPALDSSEVGAFLRRLANSSAMPLVRIATRLLMLTAVRTSELRKARWSEIDTKAKVWRIPADRMKSGEEHLVPLAPQTIDLLATLRVHTGEGDLLFPNLLNRQEPMSPNAIIGNIKNMGYAGRATGHGMRSTFSTWANEHELAFKPDAIERQLAHGPRDKVRSAYNSAKYLPERRRLMTTWADFLDEAERDNKVVNLRSA